MSREVCSRKGEPIASRQECGRGGRDCEWSDRLQLCTRIGDHEPSAGIVGYSEDWGEKRFTSAERNDNYALPVAPSLALPVARGPSFLCSYLSSARLTYDQLVNVAKYMKQIVPPYATPEEVCQLIAKTGVYEGRTIGWLSDKQAAEDYIEKHHSIRFRKYRNIYAQRLALILDHRDGRAHRQNMLVTEQIQELGQYLQTWVSQVDHDQARHFYYLLMRLNQHFTMHPPDSKMNHVLVDSLSTSFCKGDPWCRMYLKAKDGIRKLVATHNSYFSEKAPDVSNDFGLGRQVRGYLKQAKALSGPERLVYGVPAAWALYNWPAYTAAAGLAVGGAAAAGKALHLVGR